MRQETDLNKIKKWAHLLLDMDIEKTSHYPLVVSHPFTNTAITGIRNPDGSFGIGNLVENPSDLARWRQQIGQQIDEADSAFRIFAMINKPYMLAFIKYAAPYLSEKDLGEIFVSAWITNESPNNDPSMSKKDLLAIFKSVAPKYLMDAEELRLYQELEDIVTVYRGVTSYNRRNVKALSWTLDRSTAQWFAHRFGENGQVYEAQIDKRHIHAVFTGRNEAEVIVDPKHLKNIMEVPELSQGPKMSM